MKVAVESHIDLLWDLVPPSIINFIKEVLQNNTADILDVFQSLGVILTAPTITMWDIRGYSDIWSAQTFLAYPKTQDTPCD